MPGSKDKTITPWESHKIMQNLREMRNPRSVYYLIIFYNLRACLSFKVTIIVKILALYKRTFNPSRELKIFIENIETVCGLMWLSIKRSKSFLEGPKLIF